MAVTREPDGGWPPPGAVGGVKLGPSDGAPGPRLVLVRHAEPVRWARGRVIGRTDVGLSVTGRRQASDTARALGAIEHLVSSPARRALATAGPIAAANDVAIEIDDDLREIDFGAFDGRTFASVRREHPALYRAWMRDPTSVVFPGGERWPDFRERALRAIDRIAERGRSTAVVTHLGPILCALGRVRSIADAGLFAVSVEHASTHVLVGPASSATTPGRSTA